MERLQAAVARRILRAPWHTPKSDLLAQLNWPALRWRREIASLCLLHQLLNNRPEPLSAFLFPFVSSRTSHIQRKPRQLILGPARTTQYSHSFFFRTSVVWNTLPSSIQTQTDARTFKSKIIEHFSLRKVIRTVIRTFTLIYNFSLSLSLSLSLFRSISRFLSYSCTIGVIYFPETPSIRESSPCWRNKILAIIIIIKSYGPLRVSLL